MKKRTVSLVLALILLIMSCMLTPVAAEQTPYEKYKNHPMKKLWGDVIPYNDVPKGLKSTPIIIPYVAENNTSGICAVVFPGGGYSTLSTDKEGAKIAQYLNSQGISAFVVHYRTTDSGKLSYDYHAILSDGLRAIKHVRYNANEYGIDPDKIFTIGFSAGGHLTCMTATNFDFQVDDPKYTPDAIDAVSARPNAAAPCYAVSSISKTYSHIGTRTYFARGNAELELKFSAENAITENTPPIFLWHTWNDTTVPVQTCLTFAAALNDKNIPCELHIYANGSHGLGLADTNKTAKSWPTLVTEWAFRTLADKD